LARLFPEAELVPVYLDNPSRVMPKGSCLVGAAGFLALSSLVGFVLARHVETSSARDTVANLNARIRSWWGIVAVFGAAILFGRIITLALFAVISFLAFREFISLTPTRAGDHRSLFLAFFIVVPLQYWLIGID